MKIKKFLIFLIGVFAMVAMLVSCCSYKEPGFTWPAMPAIAPPIATTVVEVTGDPGEKLRVQFDRKTGKCEQIWVNDEKRDCNDEDIVIPIEETWFCTEPDDEHPANTRIYGKDDAYCGNVKFLTDGADIQYIADPAGKNRKCKKIGGKWYCYP